MSDEGEPFPGELFPSSYLVLYCPFNCCHLDSPFKEPRELTKHLQESHHTIIFKAENVIPFLDRYLSELSRFKRFENNPEIDQIIGDNDIEDKELRERLQQQVLVEILGKQEKERQLVHKKPRQCLFCVEYSATLKDLFSHMYHSHYFNIGLLDNLVMVEEFLGNLESLLQRRICIFCHQVFRSMAALNRHMRNKKHFKIDPKNHHYDKFYITNYLKCGSLGYDKKETTELEQEEENDWEDLVEEIDTLTSCLFCDDVFCSPDKRFCDHMQMMHNLDWKSLRNSMIAEESTEFDKTYDYIKIVTYFRSKMEELECPYCQKSFESRLELRSHLQEEDHCKVPSKEIWDKPIYMFPLYDDDPLLFFYEENVD